MTKNKTILFLLIIFGVFFEFIRDYIFVNFNLQMQFLHYKSLDLDATNYTDSTVLLFINSLSYSTVANLKWVLALLFSLIFFAIGLFFTKLLWQKVMYNEFKKTFIVGGLIIMISSILFYILHISLNKDPHIYAVAIELSHFVQSILYPITFILAFYANNRIKNKT